MNNYTKVICFFSIVNFAYGAQDFPDISNKNAEHILGKVVSYFVRYDTLQFLDATSETDPIIEECVSCIHDYVFEEEFGKKVACFKPDEKVEYAYKLIYGYIQDYIKIFFYAKTFLNHYTNPRRDIDTMRFYSNHILKGVGELGFFYGPIMEHEKKKIRYFILSVVCFFFRKQPELFEGQDGR